MRHILTLSHDRCDLVVSAERPNAQSEVRIESTSQSLKTACMEMLERMPSDLFDAFKQSMADLLVIEAINKGGNAQT